MAKFVIYKDAACTQVCCTVPIGYCEISGNPDINVIDAAAGKKYLYTNIGGISLLSVTNAGGSGGVIPDIPNAEWTNTYFDGGTLARMFYRSSDQLSSVYNTFVGSQSVSGSAQGGGGFGAYFAEYAGDQWLVFMPAPAGFTGNSSAVIFAITVQCLGRKSIESNYNDESHGLNDAGGNSWGGGGSNDRSTDNITIPAMPAKLSPFNLASGRGTHVYIIDGEAFDSLTGYFWGVDTSLFNSLWNKWQNLRFNPAAAVLACHALPAAFTPFGDTDINSIYLAGTPIAPIAGYCRAVTSGQFIQYPANPVYHSIDGLIDFSDFAGVEIIVHVPFCGRCVVPVSACMGGVGADGDYHSGGLAVVYRCDILTGNVCAFILCRDRNGNEACVQTLTGNCAYQIPITGNDNGAGQILGAITSTAVGAVTGNVGAVLAGAATLGLDTAQRNTAIIGNHGGSAGILTNLQCYFEITYTEYSNPANYNEVRGRPSDVGGTVKEQNGIAYSGLTIFENAHVHDIRCTPEERTEIELLLREGVYL